MEAINNAGIAAFGHRVVTEVGMELYTNVNSTGSNALSANTMQKVLQNLSVEGLPLSMNEFGMVNSTNSQTLGPAALENTLRMFYGNPLADTFMLWGWWDVAGNTPPAQLIITSNERQWLHAHTAGTKMGRPDERLQHARFAGRKSRWHD